MPKSPDKIRAQIADLQAQLKNAEAERVEQNRQRIAHAAERSKLDRERLTTELLEREFRSIRARIVADSADEKRGEAPPQGVQSPAIHPQFQEESQPSTPGDTAAEAVWSNTQKEQPDGR